MLEIILPIGLIFIIALVKKTPFIGVDIRIALLVAALTTAIISGFGFIETILAAVDGIDRLSWVIMLSIFGSLYAESQVKIGAMETTLDGFRAAFGNSPKGLVTAIFITLIFAGSLLGDAIAAATVIGFLIITSLHELKLKPEQIGMIIVVGASIGSIMPPITQGIFLSAALVDTDPAPAMNVAYFTVGAVSLFAILESIRFVRGKFLPEELQPNKTVFQIIKERWKSLIPLFVLIIIIIANTVFEYNIFIEWIIFSWLVEFLQSIPIIQGITFEVVLAIIAAFIVSFTFPSVRKDTKNVFKNGFKNVNKTVQIQISAGIMVGVFYASGVLDKVADYTEQLGGSFVKIGGTISLATVGMLTGSQTASQTINTPILAPILEKLDVSTTNIIIGASHITAGGENLPPVGLTVFVVCGLIGGILHQKVDPIKVMILALPNSLLFILIGLIAWYI